MWKNQKLAFSRKIFCEINFWQFFIISIKLFSRDYCGKNVQYCTEKIREIKLGKNTVHELISRNNFLNWNWSYPSSNKARISWGFFLEIQMRDLFLQKINQFLGNVLTCKRSKWDYLTSNLTWFLYDSHGKIEQEIQNDLQWFTSCEFYDSPTIIILHNGC